MPVAPRARVWMSPIAGFVLGFISILVLATGAAVAQSWAGQGRLSGVVLDENEQPLAGAEVRLTLEDQGGPDAVTSDDKGRWSLLGLASGRWDLAISADGYVRSQGVVVVTPGPAERQRVVMRPLSQTTGSFAEQASNLLDWIHKGNSLLEQGQPVAARAEYEKALPYLVESQKPDVLRAVARTHAAERDLDGAALALRKALVYSPDDEETRRLFTQLLSGFGRQDEAADWLARLDAEGADVLREELGIQRGTVVQVPSHRALPVDRPVESPQAHRTGAYRVRLDRASRLATLDAFLERTGTARETVLSLDPGAGDLDFATESFEVFVPDTYVPGQPGWGLFVWVSPTHFGGLARPDNLQMLADKKMMWIGANHAGNYRKVWDRVLLALEAADAMLDLYDLDPSRVYATGYSGGGRMATWLSMLYPEVFRGGFMVKGVDFYQDVPMPDRPGAHWPAAFAEPPRAQWSLVKERNRYVLFTGENDFNRLQTKTFARLYRDDGFRHVHYLEQPGADHYTAFDAQYLARAIDLLDGAADEP